MTEERKGMETIQIYLPRTHYPTSWKGTIIIARPSDTYDVKYTARVVASFLNHFPHDPLLYEILRDQRLALAIESAQRGRGK